MIALARLLLLAPVLGFAVDAAAPSTSELSRVFTAVVKPFLSRECFDCHDQENAKGRLILDRFHDLAAVKAERRTWEALRRALHDGVMPPAKRPQPAAAQRQAVVAWIEAALDHRADGPRDPGRVTVRRLNRAEYNNTIRDLTGLDLRPADRFPIDDSGFNFDNNGDVLSTSPLLLRKYLKAAEQVLDRAIVVPVPPPAVIAARRSITLASDALRSTTAGILDGVDHKPDPEPADGTQRLKRAGEVFVHQHIADDGDYLLRVRAWQRRFDDADTQDAEMAGRLDGEELARVKVANLAAQPGEFTFRVRLIPGEHRLSVAFTNPKNEPAKRNFRALHIVAFTLDGPLPIEPRPLPDSHQRLFAPGVGLPDEEAARRIVTDFAGAAFRGPVARDELDALLGMYRSSRAAGDRHEQAVKVALMTALVSPRFLFRIETGDAPSGPSAPIRRLTDHELAARLSYFLWSTQPDARLRALADDRRLRDAAVLAAEVTRMLADAKADALVEGFAGQWLGVRAMQHVTPDTKVLKGFDASLLAAMRKEIDLFVTAIMRENRSLLELIDADYTFVNDRLAKHYGMADVSGSEFRKVSVAGTPRGGVLTMAGILTLTSNATRTNPIKRGKWVLEELLDCPPPPPPPDAPALPEKTRARDGKQVDAQTVRQRLEQHRADPRCASCHSAMDPIGFALENFDAIGAWRTVDEDLPIDPKDRLRDGSVLDGPRGLKDLLLSRKKEFVRCFVEKLLSYALGRGIEPADGDTVTDICMAAQAGGYVLPAVIQAIVAADAFQKLRVSDAGTPASGKHEKAETAP